MRLLPVVKARVSPPPNPIESVLNVVLSFTVRVLAPRVSVPVPVVIALPLIEAKVAAPVPSTLQPVPLMVLLVKASAPARVARVPVVGKVTLVVPVVVRVRLLPVVKARVSPPPNPIESVLNVVLSFTVRVLAPRVSVPVPVVIALPLIEAKVAAPVPSTLQPVPLMVLLVKASAPARVARVPVVGKVTLVAPVVVRVRLLPVVKARVSPPPNPIESVLNVVLSFTVRVLAPRVSVPVPVVIALPLIEVKVPAPALEIRVVPPSCKAPVATFRLPAETTIFWPGVRVISFAPPVEVRVSAPALVTLGALPMAPALVMPPLLLLMPPVTLAPLLAVSVPAITVLPFLSTVNLLVLTAMPPLAFSKPLNVMLPVTVSVSAVKPPTTLAPALAVKRALLRVAPGIGSQKGRC